MLVFTVWVCFVQQLVSCVISCRNFSQCWFMVKLSRKNTCYFNEIFISLLHKVEISTFSEVYFAKCTARACWVSLNKVLLSSSILSNIPTMCQVFKYMFQFCHTFQSQIFFTFPLTNEQFSQQPTILDKSYRLKTYIYKVCRKLPIESLCVEPTVFEVSFPFVKCIQDNTYLCVKLCFFETP